MKISKDSYKLSNQIIGYQIKNFFKVLSPLYALTEPGYINIGWNYKKCTYDTVLPAYHMFNDRIFIEGSVEPDTFLDAYILGDCGQSTILSWFITDTDPKNSYYITIGLYGSSFDIPGVDYHISVQNRTVNPMKIHLYTTRHWDYLYSLAPNETRIMVINNH